MLYLTTNMRIEKVKRDQGNEAAKRCEAFNKHLLEIGIGRQGGVKSEDVLCDPAWTLKEDTVDQLIEEIFGDLRDVKVTADEAKLLNRCILAPTNEQCNIVNDRCMELFHVSVSDTTTTIHASKPDPYLPCMAVSPTAAFWTHCLLLLPLLYINSHTTTKRDDLPQPRLPQCISQW